MIPYEGKTVQDGLTRHSFAEYVRDDFVDRGLTISVDQAGVIRELYFNSSRHGYALWREGRGLCESHRWEDEDQAQAPSYLTRHYTVTMANGAVSGEYAFELIIPDILDHLEDRKLAEMIGEMVKERSTEARLDAGKYGG